MKIPVSHWKEDLRNKELRSSIALSLLFLLVSLVINFFAAAYASESVSNPVTDIILSNIPVFNVGLIFIYTPLIFWAIIAYACIIEPKKIPFILKSIALFVVIRSVFISLTHLGPFPDQVVFSANPAETIWAISLFSTGGDLFFSGHTGLPFLMALVFWNHKTLRWFSVFASVFFGCIVLMGHLHYSIDVLSAFFITYAIFHIARQLFPKDKEVFGI